MKKGQPSTKNDADQLTFESNESQPNTKIRKTTERRANDLDGATWTRYSISVWNDIRKSKEEIRLNHPAMFPSALIERLIDCFTSKNDSYILDPFLGSGSTIIGAQKRHKIGIGLEIYDHFIDLSKQRL